MITPVFVHELTSQLIISLVEANATARHKVQGAGVDFDIPAISTCARMAAGRVKVIQRLKAASLP
jgi:hypothetical protein